MNHMFDPTSTTVILSRHAYAEVLRGLGRLREAETEHRAVLALGEREFGEENFTVLSTCYRLALTLEAEKKYPEALAYARRAERAASGKLPRRE